MLNPLETHRSHIILALKALTITVATLILFHQDLTIIFSDALQSEITNYMLAIPIIFTYLIYRKRKTLRVVITFETPMKLKQPTKM